MIILGDIARTKNTNFHPYDLRVETVAPLKRYTPKSIRNIVQLEFMNFGRVETEKTRKSLKTAPPFM